MTNSRRNCKGKKRRFCRRSRNHEQDGRQSVLQHQAESQQRQFPSSFHELRFDIAAGLPDTSCKSILTDWNTMRKRGSWLLTASLMLLLAASLAHAEWQQIGQADFYTSSGSLAVDLSVDSGYKASVIRFNGASWAGARLLTWHHCHRRRQHALFRLHEL
jgi:hypothetical protein